jgi:hypothetical protein
MRARSGDAGMGAPPIVAVASLMVLIVLMVLMVPPL